MASGSRDDDLAHTATVAGEARPAAEPALGDTLGEARPAPAAAEPALGDTLGEARPAPAAAEPALGDTLGRYRLEAKLGEGGMGVVHAAFDPDLERRVALKVLRASAGSADARQRLLREARAMARLAHGNVVVVHEVGSVAGRDYVAMELIDGTNLADWLRAEPRTPADIVGAFLAAGRGLAAAHAAGLVHRDFKPHNVLRGRDGRIVVTDFGLARGVEATAVAIALETTLDVGGGSHSNTPSALVGLTLTGSVLGTPAYMAPEQWNAQTIGPAADQFAFCVALWEALAGERPYRGDTIEQLKAAVLRGPVALDDGKLPRPLRAAVRRGLDPDPAKRWPAMTALLAALEPKPPARRAPIIAGGAAAAVAIAAGIALVATSGGTPSPAPIACAPPARALATVWTPARRAALAARAPLVAALDRDAAAWTAARASACADHAAPKLACLDGVLARTDAILAATARTEADVTDRAIGMLVDPAACGAAAATPRLQLASTPDTAAAFALWLDDTAPASAPAEHAAAAFAARAGLDPCARAIADLAVDSITRDVERGREAAADAVTSAETCGDDRVRADAVLQESPYEYETPIIGARAIAALARAKAAVDRVAQADLVARIELERANLAGQQEHWDEAFAATANAIEGFGKRGRTRAQLRAVRRTNDLRIQRNGAGDMAALRASVAEWLPRARALHEEREARRFVQSDGYAQLFLGDVAGGHATLMTGWTPMVNPGTPTRAIDGVVVDERGAPVAGAVVAVAPQLFFDAIGPVPFSQEEVDPLQIATTDAAGRFALPAGPIGEATIGAQRSATDPTSRALPQVAADHVRLVLGPTRRLAGKVALDADQVAAREFVMASIPGGPRPGAYVLVSTLTADGAFAITGVPTAALKVGVASWGTALSARVQFVPLAAGTRDRLDLALGAPRSGRELTVIARSAVVTPLDTAQVFLVPGKVAFTHSDELFTGKHIDGIQVRLATPIIGEGIPKPAIGKTHTGDLIARFTDVAPGDVSACVVGLNGDIANAEVNRKLNAHHAEIVMKCETPGPGEAAIVVEAPPQKRFD